MAVRISVHLGARSPNSWNVVRSRHPFSKAWLQLSQTVTQPCMWSTEEPSQFSVGKTAQSLNMFYHGETTYRVNWLSDNAAIMLQKNDVWSELLTRLTQKRQFGNDEALFCTACCNNTCRCWHWRGCFGRMMEGPNKNRTDGPPFHLGDGKCFVKVNKASLYFTCLLVPRFRLFEWCMLRRDAKICWVHLTIITNHLCTLCTNLRIPHEVWAHQPWNFPKSTKYCQREVARRCSSFEKMLSVIS